MTESELRDNFRKKGADWEFTQEILAALNSGTLRVPPVQVQEFPQIDGRQVLDLRGDKPIVFPRASVEKAFKTFFPELNPENFWKVLGDSVEIAPAQLEDLGLRLSQLTAFGILNGGMATSYGDSKKNQALGTKVFEIYQDDLEKLASLFQGRPKGITPAFFQSNGDSGPSYMELKIRHMLQINQAARKRGLSGPGMRLFQMTSQSTHRPILDALQAYEKSPFLSGLFTDSTWKPTDTLTEIQSLIGTFTPASTEGKRSIFTIRQNGQEEIYPLPGGHGQNFRVLRKLYRNLEDQGYRFVYLGNVDNIGYLTSLRSLALLALSGASAAFDFSFKTPIDVKGGVLYREPSGKLNCADIGVGIPATEVKTAEQNGLPILFNCATGLFDLTQLNRSMESILAGLPVRVSDQDKDVGKYAQAEQVTWEVIGLLEKPLILGIEKSRRFLAAKLLLDCLMTSGLHLDDPRYQDPSLETIRNLATGMNAGLADLLYGPLSMSFKDGRWVPLSGKEIDARLERDGIGFLAV